MARVTGLGGVFFKSADTAASKAWYADVLGIAGEYGIMFRAADDTPDGFSQMSAFGASTDYFAPSSLPFMINLRVDDLDGMIERLKSKNVEILGRQDEDYGNFAWILDPDGIKIELWQQLGPPPDA